MILFSWNILFSKLIGSILTENLANALLPLLVGVLPVISFI